MKVVVQRVKEASVTNDTLNNQIRKGYCLLVGIGQELYRARCRCNCKENC